MSNVSTLSRPAPTPNAYSTPASGQIADGIVSIFRGLPPEDQHVLLQTLNKLAPTIIPATRAGDVLGTVVRFIGKKKDWTAEEIREQVAWAGVAATTREVFNAIGYLARKGQLQRLGNGKYMVAGIGIQTSDDFGGEPSRYED